MKIKKVRTVEETQVGDYTAYIVSYGENGGMGVFIPFMSIETCRTAARTLKSEPL